jgi:hypothetical protein
MEGIERRSGLIALSLCLGGLSLAVLIGMLAKLLGHDASMPAYLVFLGFQIAGFVMGIVSRQKVLGKTAYITSAVLALGSIFIIA